MHDGQALIRASDARFKVCAIGRRWGKTWYGFDEAVEEMLNGGNVGWFAPTYKLLAGEGGVWPYAKRLLTDITERVSEQDKTLRIIGGGLCEFWSMDNDGGDKARGREYDLIVDDECAMQPDLLDQWDNALRPMLATRQGRGLFLSTPRGYNDFYKLYLRGQSDEYPEWASFHAPSSESPYFPADEWKALEQSVLRGELAAATFAQEYEAIFTAPEGLVYGLDRDGVAFYEPRRNVRPARVAWAECKWRVAAIDPGGDSDPTGLVALGVDADDRVHVYYASRPAGKVSIFDIDEWLNDLHKQGPLDAVMVGETGGSVQVESLRRLGWRTFKAALAPGDRGRRIQLMREWLKSGRFTIGPAFRALWDSEVYVYRFRERKAGEASATPFATVVDSSEHHAEILDACGYGVAGIHDGYPTQVQAAGIVRASASVGIRRAG